MVMACQQSSLMLINLINDMLDLAKQENVTFQFSKHYFNLKKSVEDSFDTLKYISNCRGIETILRYEKHHLKYFEQIYGDSGRLQQILLNLISNSLKFTNNGGSVTVKLEVKEISQASSRKVVKEDKMSELSKLS